MLRKCIIIMTAILASPIYALAQALHRVVCRAVCKAAPHRVAMARKELREAAQVRRTSEYLPC
jgi:hypothetical protein